MITEYKRPETIDEALKLLGRQSPRTLPLGGGTFLSQHTEGEVAVIDLQSLGLNLIEKTSSMLEVGAAVTLQALLESHALPAALEKAIHHEAGQNLRSQASIAGTIVTSDGRSPLVTALLAVNTRLVWLPGNQEASLGDYLALRENWSGGSLIRSVQIPLNGDLKMEMVARSPLDRPILAVAVCRWASGRTRVALGGYGKAAILAMDGPEPVGADLAVRNAYQHADDAWASSAYRSQVGMEIVGRLLAENE